MGSGSSPSSSGNLGRSSRRVVLSQVAVRYPGQSGVLRSAANELIVSCLITWITLPEPMANQTPLCAMQWTGPGMLLRA
jgi:hypothetical protein